MRSLNAGRTLSLGGWGKCDVGSFFWNMLFGRFSTGNRFASGLNALLLILGDLPPRFVRAAGGWVPRALDRGLSLCLPPSTVSFYNVSSNCFSLLPFPDDLRLATCPQYTAHRSRSQVPL